jgi:hypothetical protein
MREGQQKAMLTTMVEVVPLPKSRGGRISSSVSMN